MTTFTFTFTAFALLIRKGGNHGADIVRTDLTNTLIKLFSSPQFNNTYQLVPSCRGIKPKICRSGPTGLWAGYAPASVIWIRYYIFPRLKTGLSIFLNKHARSLNCSPGYTGKVNICWIHVEVSRVHYVLFKAKKKYSWSLACLWS